MSDSTPLNPHVSMAVRDLHAAARAARDGRSLTALSLALDAIAGLTAQAAEGQGTFIPFGDEMVSPSIADPWSEDIARKINAEASALLNQLPTLWSSVKRYRNGGDRKPVEIL